MKSAIHVGIRIQEYNEMTPYELNLYINDSNEKKLLENEEKLTLAWLGAAWQRSKKMPSLNKVLGKDKAKKQMTSDEMFNVVKQLNAAFGGEVK